MIFARLVEIQIFFDEPLGHVGKFAYFRQRISAIVESDRLGEAREIPLNRKAGMSSLTFDVCVFIVFRLRRNYS